MSEDLQHQAEAMRRMWSSVVLAVLSDYWRDAAKKGADLSNIRRHALSYFRSRDGREVLSLAGITVDPDRMADTAIDLTARERTVLGRGCGMTPFGLTLLAPIAFLIQIGMEAME